MEKFEYIKKPIILKTKTAGLWTKIQPQTSNAKKILRVRQNPYNDEIYRAWLDSKHSDQRVAKLNRLLQEDCEQYDEIIFNKKKELERYLKDQSINLINIILYPEHYGFLDHIEIVREFLQKVIQENEDSIFTKLCFFTFNLIYPKPSTKDLLNTNRANNTKIVTDTITTVLDYFKQIKLDNAKFDFNDDSKIWILIEACTEITFQNILSLESRISHSYLKELIENMIDLKISFSGGLTYADITILARYGLFDGEKGLLRLNSINLSTEKNKLEIFFLIEIGKAIDPEFRKMPAFKNYHNKSETDKYIETLKQKLVNSIIAHNLEVNKAQVSAQSISDALSELLNFKSVYNINNTLRNYHLEIIYLFEQDKHQEIHDLFTKLKALYQYRNSEKYKLDFQALLDKLLIDTSKMKIFFPKFMGASLHQIGILALVADDVGFAMECFFNDGAKDIDYKEILKFQTENINPNFKQNILVQSSEKNQNTRFLSQIGVAAAYFKQDHKIFGLTILKKIIDSLFNSTQAENSTSENTEDINYIFFEKDTYISIEGNTSSQTLRIDPSYIVGLSYKIRNLYSDIVSNKVSTYEAYLFIIKHVFYFYKKH